MEMKKCIVLFLFVIDVTWLLKQNVWCLFMSWNHPLKMLWACFVSGCDALCLSCTVRYISAGHLISLLFTALPTFPLFSFLPTRPCFQHGCRKTSTHTRLFMLQRDKYNHILRHTAPHLGVYNLGWLSSCIEASNMYFPQRLDAFTVTKKPETIRKPTRNGGY